MLLQLVKSLIVFLYLFLLPPFIFAQTPTNLELNKPIEREISGSDKFIYQIALNENQYAKITVEQKGVDIRVRLMDSDNKPLNSSDFEVTNRGFETIEFVAKTAEKYLFEVSKSNLLTTGNYQIKFAELRTATDKDKALDEARRLTYQANALWLNDKMVEALPLANRALEIAERELGADDLLVSQILFIVANQYSYNDNSAKAEPIYQRALAIREKILGKNSLQLSFILKELGSLYKNEGNYVKAEEFYKRTLEIREKNLQSGDQPNL